MKRDLFLLRSIAVCMFMLLMPFISFAADTVRVNISRVTVTMARSYNFTSAANSVYVPVEFNSTMSADKVADYIEESNAFLFDHYGDDVATDEDGNLFTTYTDDEGKLIMERRRNTRYPSICHRELYPYMQAHTGTVMTDLEGLQQAADMREVEQVQQTAGARGG